MHAVEMTRHQSDDVAPAQLATCCGGKGKGGKVLKHGRISSEAVIPREAHGHGIGVRHVAVSLRHSDVDGGRHVVQWGLLRS
jgi:hypothetical protein